MPGNTLEIAYAEEKCQGSRRRCLLGNEFNCQSGVLLTHDVGLPEMRGKLIIYHSENVAFTL